MHASRQGEVRLAPLQTRHRLVHRNERRRAGGVHRHRRPRKAQRKGDPPDGGVERSAADRVKARGGFRGIADLQDKSSVFIVADARIHAGPAAPEPFRIHPRILDRLPARLQHEPLLGVQELGLDRRNAEKRGVEQVDLIQVPAEAAGLALHLGVGEKHAHAPHARTRNALGHRVLAGLEQTPEGRNPGRAGEAARHAHNRYGVSAPGSFRRPVFRFIGRIEIPVRAHQSLPQVQISPGKYPAATSLWNESIIQRAFGAVQQLFSGRIHR